MCAYQMFNDQPGDSNSPAKLTAIKMPTDLRGKRVLDAGCNEGFFCNEAHLRGSPDVVGIDCNAHLVARAKRRFPECAFHTCPVLECSVGTFDLILCLSAIHYSGGLHEHGHWIVKLTSMLRPGGLLILECGVIERTDEEPVGRWIRRHTGDKRWYPTREALEEYVASLGLDVKCVGPSVAQRGDPTPRSVFHISNTAPVLERTVIYVTGKPDIGKTTLAAQFHIHGFETVRVDRVMVDLGYQKGLLAGQLKRCSDRELKNIGIEIARHILERTSGPVVFAEGYALRFKVVQESLTAALTGFRVWMLSAIRAPRKSETPAR